MKSVSEIIKRTVDGKEYEIQVFYTKAKNVYLTYDNGIFSLRGAFYNLSGPLFETFLIKSMKKQIKKEGFKKTYGSKQKLGIDFDNQTFYYFGQKVNFSINDYSISIFSSENELIDYIKKPKNKNTVLEITSLINNHTDKKLKMIFEKYANEASLLILKTYEKLTFIVRNKKNTWATINTSNNKININSDLKYFSEDLIKYVAYHEIAHKLEHNHGPKFWNIVKKFISDYKIKIFKLNNYIIDK
ncbi:M48 family metallopeptidase [Mycoplasma enhydrae]|uniref:M48 metallopeptidase family protein n=1 Tax=Mycoplasma enhydrae TaxID=2499220 RepID=UPI0021E77366|nr:M48 family metallopeptidase [Mycoplasma enhydrae]MCV3753450.1 M48 family metallopeptidase [Mycoplasma enhydrae]